MKSILRRYVVICCNGSYILFGPWERFGHDPPRDGFGVQLGIREAKALAQTFKQLAFYLVENDELFLVDSESLDTKSLGLARASSSPVSRCVHYLKSFRSAFFFDADERH